MRLTLDRLTVKNFKSFYDAAIIDLMPCAGLHFLRGKNELDPRMGGNAVGKSSLFDALCWVLFGRTPAGLRTPDIRPWDSEGTTAIGLNFHIGTTPHRLHRTAAPNKLSLDGEILDQEALEKFLGFNISVFCHTVLLGQGQPLFFDLSPRAKMDLFSEILALERWTERSALASAVVTRLQDEIAVLREELAGFAGELKALDEASARAKTSAEEWRKEQNKKIAAVGEELAVLRKRRDKLQAAQDEYAVKLDGAQTELKPLEKQIEKQRVIADDERRIWVREKELAMYTSQLASALQPGEDCPTCGQVMGKAVARHKAELEKKVAISERACKAANERRIAAEKTLENLTKTLANFRETTETAQDKLNVVSPDLSGVKAQIAELMKQQTERRDHESNPYQETLADLRRKIAQLEVKQEKRETALKVAERALSRHKFWVSGFKDVRLYLIEEVLEELTMATNTMLTTMGLEDWSVKYSIEKETKAGTVLRGLNVSIQSPDNPAPVRWESWSGGEGQRLRLIGALALGEVLLNHAGVEPSLEVLDEPTRHLSSEGIRDLCECLAERGARLGKAIWLIDHHALESSAFSSVVSVIKSKAGSRLD